MPQSTEIKSEKGEMVNKFDSTMEGKGIPYCKRRLTFSRKNRVATEFIIEQESYQGKSIFECLKEDLKIGKSWGYYFLPQIGYRARFFCRILPDFHRKKVHGIRNNPCNLWRHYFLSPVQNTKGCGKPGGHSTS